MENEILYDRLDKLMKEQKFLFALSCSERLLPLYNNFSKKFEIIQSVDGFRLLDSFIQKGFKVFESGQNMMITSESAEEIVEQCLELTPDIEDYPTYDADLAQKPSLSVAYSYNLIYDDDINLIHYCSDMFLQSTYIIEMKNNFSQARYDVLIKEEIKIQEKMLDLIDQNRIREFREFSNLNKFEM
jgi:uncharacterized protein YjaG (DUF416 family)